MEYQIKRHKSIEFTKNAAQSIHRNHRQITSAHRWAGIIGMPKTRSWFIRSIEHNKTEFLLPKSQKTQHEQFSIWTILKPIVCSQIEGNTSHARIGTRQTKIAIKILELKISTAKKRPWSNWCPIGRYRSEESESKPS